MITKRVGPNHNPIFKALVNIPHSKNKERGELLFYPNARKYPRTEIQNIIGKVLFKKYANKASMNKLIKSFVFHVLGFLNIWELGTSR